MEKLLLRWRTHLEGVRFTTAVGETLGLYYTKELSLHWLDKFLTAHLGGIWYPTPAMKDRALPLAFALVIVAPLSETFLHQWLVFWAAAKMHLLPKHLMLTIAVSAVLFGAAHFYSAGYILSATGSGFVLAAAFWAYGQNWKAFWMLVTAHAIINGVATILTLSSRAHS
jgi:hypothetical protein